MTKIARYSRPSSSPHNQRLLSRSSIKGSPHAAANRPKPKSLLSALGLNVCLIGAGYFYLGKPVIGTLVFFLAALNVGIPLVYVFQQPQARDAGGVLMIAILCGIGWQVLSAIDIAIRVRKRRRGVVLAAPSLSPPPPLVDPPASVPLAFQASAEASTSAADEPPPLPTDQGSADDACWYYTQHGQRQGPATGVAVRDLLRQGVLTPADLGWRKGMSEWKPLRDLPITSESDTPPPVPATANTWSSLKRAAILVLAIGGIVGFSSAVISTVQGAWADDRSAKRLTTVQETSRVEDEKDRTIPEYLQGAWYGLEFSTDGGTNSLPYNAVMLRAGTTAIDHPDHGRLQVERVTSTRAKDGTGIMRRVVTITVMNHSLPFFAVTDTNDANLYLVQLIDAAKAKEVNRIFFRVDPGQAGNQVAVLPPDARPVKPDESTIYTIILANPQIVPGMAWSGSAWGNWSRRC